MIAMFKQDRRSSGPPFTRDEFAWLREVYHEGSQKQRASAFTAVLLHFQRNHYDRL